ncbi:MAG: single-stranded-DNA-specific exonuclease RecJ [Desulfobacterales bacterium]|jgi:single-stranded-DNA-specific exonuclease|nr:single-stranded-DNA-specific exonuclease RecJ [Desulfobacterales bacterium]
MKKQWHLRAADEALAGRLATALNCHPAVAAVLVNRGIDSPEKAHSFLNASLAELRPPTELKDMDKAVGRLARAVTSGEEILLFGDYDVDGTTATALLFEFLKRCNARVSYYIPHRLREGYGFQPRHIAEVALPRKAGLLITVDCGSASHDAVAAARAAGIDVIVTDHHNLKEPIPAAVAVINPKRRDCPSGLVHLAGVGVAFCLVIALRKHLRERRFWQQRPEPNLRALCDLVALGTIADMVPLVADNRILAKAGLDLLGSVRRPGLAELMEASGIVDRRAEAEDVAFRLGPRLNAAGRIGHGGLSVELLTTESMERARSLAQQLSELNSQRQLLEKQVLKEIDAQIARRPELLELSSLVFAGEGWHEGVVGVVASRVMERYYRPTVVIALNGSHGRGSARSVPGIDLYACLSACEERLEELGGHPQAAGLRIAAAEVAAFQAAFEQSVRRALRPEHLMPVLTIDAELNLSDISAELADQLARLMPYGAGNPEPLFMARDIHVVSSAPVGTGHRRMLLRQASAPAGPCLQAIQFNADRPEEAPAHFERMAFALRWNHWNGSRSLQAVVAGTQPAGCVSSAP